MASRETLILKPKSFWLISIVKEMVSMGPGLPRWPSWGCRFLKLLPTHSEGHSPQGALGFFFILHGLSLCLHAPFLILSQYGVAVAGDEVELEEEGFLLVTSLDISRYLYPFWLKRFTREYSAFGHTCA